MSDFNVFNAHTQGGVNLSPHFKVSEFACKDGSAVVIVHDELPGICETAREINGPFSPNSAYRTISHNRNSGGATYSNHIFGRAVDIPAVKATPQELYNLFVSRYPDSMEIGIYSWGIHVGVQSTKSRFKG